MPARVCCPHCRTPCLVAEQHFGVPVQCGRCGRTFTTRGEGTTPRLDVGAASSGPARADGFFLQHLVCSNLDERRDLAVLAIASGESLAGDGFHALAAALAPLISNFLNGTTSDTTGAAEIVAALGGLQEMAVVVIADGQACLTRAAHSRVSFVRGGQLVQGAGKDSPALKLAVGDWIVVVGAWLYPRLDAATIQTAITGCSTASQAAEQLLQRVHPQGVDSEAVLAVRCF